MVQRLLIAAKDIAITLREKGNDVMVSQKKRPIAYSFQRSLYYKFQPLCLSIPQGCNYRCTDQAYIFYKIFFFCHVQRTSCVQYNSGKIFETWYAFRKPVAFTRYFLKRRQSRDSSDDCGTLLPKMMHDTRTIISQGNLAKVAGVHMYSQAAVHTYTCCARYWNRRHRVVVEKTTIIIHVNQNHTSFHLNMGLARWEIRFFYSNGLKIFDLFSISVIVPPIFSKINT